MATIVDLDPEMTAIVLFREYQPDVTLMDLRMPQMDSVEAIVAICAEFKQARIMVLTTSVYYPKTA